MKTTGGVDVVPVGMLVPLTNNDAAPLVELVIAALDEVRAVDVLLKAVELTV